MLLTISWTAPAVAHEVNCGHGLTSHIEHVLARGLPRSRSFTRDIGVPVSNPNASTVSLAEGRVRLFTDLGPSEWPVAELDAWFSLEPITRSPRRAKEELDRILNADDYCTPGIGLELCGAMRLSRKMARQAYQEIVVPRNGGERDGAQAYFHLARRVRHLHEQRALIRFAFGSEAAYLPADISPTTARAIFRILTRELLIRHLVSPNGTGPADLDLETRLVLAAAPVLIPFAPISEIAPIRFSPYSSLGDTTHGARLGLLQIEFPGPMRPTLYVDLEADEVSLPALDAFIYALPETPGATLSYEDLALEVKDKLATLATAFRQEMNVKQRLRFTVEWEDDRLDIQLEGPSRLEKILFYYFVADNLRK